MLRARAVAAAPAAQGGPEALVALAKAFVAEAVGAAADSGAPGEE
mgnify:CR=1 FL=1